MINIDSEMHIVEEEWGRATVAADEAAMQKLISDDAMMFHGSGAVENKALFIANLFRRIEVQAVIRDHAHVRQLAPTVVVVSCVQEQRIRTRDSDGPFKVVHANISRVWTRRDGRWQMANYHATRLSERT